MKEKARNFVSAIFICFIGSLVFSVGIWGQGETNQGFFEILLNVFFVSLIVAVVVWIISLFYRLSIYKGEITERRNFIEAIQQDLENLEGYEKEDFEELKEELVRIRKETEDYLWNI